jgi:DNA-binding CsgD family transcriptional regulator
MHFDHDLIDGALASVVSRFAGKSRLTPAEHAEVLRIAQGFACKDSAAAADLSPETIRARRKNIYRKLGLVGANELIAALLAHTVAMLGSGARVDPAAATPERPATAAGTGSAVAP